MKYGYGGIEYNIDMGEDLDRAAAGTNLRISYKVPWCRICKNHVEKFSIEKNTPRAGVDTLVAECHGRTHTREIRSESGTGTEQTDVFFNERSQSTFLGKDVTDKLANKDHDMAEIDARMKNLGMGEVGDGGEILWGKK